MCAKTEAMPKPVPRIVGDAVNATYAPFQVRLIYVDEAMDDMSYCGGTIISQRFVLTASHCLNKPLTEFDLVVVFGSLNYCTVMKAVRKNPKGPWKNAVLAEKLYPHPEYTTNFNKEPENDIAIIKLSKELDLIEGKVMPACLPPRSG